MKNKAIVFFLLIVFLYSSSALSAKEYSQNGSEQNGSVFSEEENYTPFFEDVPTDAWYFDAVAYLFNRNAVQGTGDLNFSPNDPITRAEFLDVISHLDEEGKNNVKDTAYFADVPKESWYYSSVQWGVDNGIILGKDETHFYPNQFLTREEAAVIVYRFSERIIGEKWDIRTATSSFLDDSDISRWAEPAVATLSKNSIISGYQDGTFKPLKEVTRAEAVQLLGNYLLSDKSEIEIEFDEWEEILNLKQKTDVELAELGYTSEEISYIRNFNIRSQIYILQQYTDEQLKNQGYSTEEINEIRAINVFSASPSSYTPSATKSFASNRIKVSIVIEKLQSTTPKSYAVVYSTWEWTKKPFILYRDAVFLGWNQEMKFMDQHPTKSRRTLYRKNEKTGAITTWRSGPYQNYENYDMNKSIQIGLFSLGEIVDQDTVIGFGENNKPISATRYYYNYTYKGCARIALEKKSLVKSIKANITYAHYIKKVNSLSYSFDSDKMKFTTSPYTAYKYSLSASRTNK